VGAGLNAERGKSAVKHHALIVLVVIGLSAYAGVSQAYKRLGPEAAATGQTPAAMIPPSGEQQKAEAAPRKTIAGFQASKPNLEDMDAPLAGAVTSQSAALSALLTGWGALSGIAFKGWDAQNGVWAFDATFEKGRAQCLIGFSKAGKIQTLWFKPVAG